MIKEVKIPTESKKLSRETKPMTGLNGFKVLNRTMNTHNCYVINKVAFKHPLHRAGTRLVYHELFVLS